MKSKENETIRKSRKADRGQKTKNEQLGTES